MNELMKVKARMIRELEIVNVHLTKCQEIWREYQKKLEADKTVKTFKENIAKSQIKEVTRHETDTRKTRRE